MGEVLSSRETQQPHCPHLCGWQGIFLVSLNVQNIQKANSSENCLVYVVIQNKRTAITLYVSEISPKILGSPVPEKAHSLCVECISKNNLLSANAGSFLFIIQQNSVIIGTRNPLQKEKTGWPSSTFISQAQS